MKDIKYYSQCGEDEFLNTNYFKNKRDGVYIELGALDGILYSNTKFFEDQLDWKGILIEPHPYKFQDLTNNRPKNYLFNNLVSFIEDEVVFRFFLDNYSGVSGVENTLPKEHLEGFYTYINEPQGKITIKPKTLTEIIKSTDIQHIDLLSLDVEGHEYEVLLSWDFSIPIDVILIETLGGSQIEKENMCREILIKNGYKFDTKYKHNEVFILDKNDNISISNDPNTIFGITPGTDLLGSFSLYIVFARILADNCKVKLNFNENANIHDFSNTGAKDLYLSSAEQYQDQIMNRKIICDSLISCDDNPNVDLGNVGLVQNNLLHMGFTKCLLNYQENMRNDILKNLPIQNYIDTTNSIVIHFRCGEVIDMNNRYIHSTNYLNLINNFKQNMPEKEIIIFSGPLPPKEHDDLKAFEGLKMYIQDNDSPNELEIWRIFIECHILVTARSGFSYTPALFREHSKKTYYAEFWHPKPNYWITWYKDNQ